MILFDELIDNFLVVGMRFRLWDVLVLPEYLPDNFGSLVALLQYLELCEFDSCEDGERKMEEHQRR